MSKFMNFLSANTPGRDDLNNFVSSQKNVKNRKFGTLIFLFFVFLTGFLLLTKISPGEPVFAQ